MNYMTEINLFNNYLETADLPSNAIVVWYALMFAANRCGWREEFSVPFSVLESRTKLNKSTICRMRRVLAGQGLIAFREQGGRRSALYRVHSFELQTALHSATLSSTQNDPESAVVLQGATVCAPITKQDRDVLKDKPPTWFSTIVAPWRELMQTWLEYKRTRGEGYRSEVGVKKCLSMLRTLSDDSPSVAARIIDRSIANNWAGLFPLQKSSGIHEGQVIRSADKDRERRLMAKFHSKR